MSKYISGKDIKSWSVRAKANSFHPDRAAVKHNLGTEGANADYAAPDLEDWKQPQKKSEGDCWAKPVNPVAAKNVYGGKGGSKRD